jgi:hypothetical protein
MTKSDTRRFALLAAAAAIAVALGFWTVHSSAPAQASEMNLNATGGDATAVDKDGTQGDFKPAIQGTSRTGDQDAYDFNSWEAVPQFKASHK